MEERGKETEGRTASQTSERTSKEDETGKGKEINLKRRRKSKLRKREGRGYVEGEQESSMNKYVEES